MPGLQDTVFELADRIEELYVFPDVARAIAGQLRTRPVTTTDPGELAADVKAFLRGHDNHLNLRWLLAPPAPAGTARGDVSDPEYQRRINYGFRSAGLIEDGVGLLDLTLIADTDVEPVLAAAVAATTMVAHADAIVLDLRGVPGGWPSGANMLAGHFLAADPTHLLTMTRRGEPEQEDWTPVENPLGYRPDVPLFVLIDADSASAAEAFAYTAQSLGRATVVGQRSAGAANPGDLFPIGEEFTAFIPTMAPVDPRTGGNWEGVGVLPDLVTEPGRTMAAALELARRERAT